MNDITRRQFAGSVVAPMYAGLAAAQAPPKWNLLMITNDQHRAECLGTAGNKVIRTPNVDRLAAEGAMF